METRQDFDLLVAHLARGRFALCDIKFHHSLVRPEIVEATGSEPSSDALGELDWIDDSVSETRSDEPVD
jgi:hypothetical protein